MRLIGKKLKVKNARYYFIFSLFTFHFSLFTKTGFSFFTFALLFFTFHFSLLVNSAQAQSTNQNYPTAVTTNEINGKIAARDIGDSRLTSYFYVFNGDQGDVFINIQASNFNGDIDVFTADNLKPLTKITIYADLSETETGRVVYLRKPEKLILRIEGRTPNDDPATFKIKFAGSFAAITNIPETPDAPEVKTQNKSDIRVNSVGTIIEIKPKPTPKPKETVAGTEPKPKSKKNDERAENKELPIEKSIKKTETKENIPNESTQTVAENQTETEKANEQPTQIIIEKQPETKSAKTIKNPPAETKPQVVITDDLTKPELEKPLVENKPETSAKITIEKTPEPEAIKTVEKNPKSAAKTPKPKEPNPLENIRLIVLFKDGTKIERPMSDVLKVSVDKGILTVISKGGAIGRYSILDVAKMTIE